MPKLESVGREEYEVPGSEMFDVKLEPASTECFLDRGGEMGEFNPKESPYSIDPDQARYTTSCIGGVNNDNVRCDSAKVARRIRFLWEKSDCASVVESSDKDSISAESRTRPFESTGS